MQAASEVDGGTWTGILPDMDSAKYSGLDRNTAFVRGDWAFYMTTWPETTVQILEEDLKAVWADS